MTMRLTTPFWVNKVQGLPTDSPSSLTLSDLLYCNDKDDNEVWTHVILASYLIDMEWILQSATSLLHIRRQLVVILGDQRKKVTCQESATSGGLTCEKVTVIIPPIPLPYGIHHAKMAICANARGLRVSIFTGNLVAGDWLYKTQGIYVQDFPKRETNSKNDSLDTDYCTSKGMRFKYQLNSYLEFCGVFRPKYSHTPLPEDFLDAFNFCDVAVELLVSLPGYYKCPKAYCFGLGGLHRCLQMGSFLSSSNTQVPVLTWQYSSQGKLTDAFLVSMENTMLTEPLSLENDTKSIAPIIRIVYPTEYEVRMSIEGWKGGLSLPVHLKCCHPYINKRLHRWGQRKEGASKSFLSRDNALPHLKTYMRLNDDRSKLKWFILTSANMSRAAWGEWQKKGTQLMIRSYELGVFYDSTSLIPLLENSSFSVTPSRPIAVPSSTNGDGLTKVHIEATSMQIEPVLFLPYDPLTPVPYASTTQMRERNTEDSLNTTDVPWVVDIPHIGLDSQGRCVHNALSEENTCQCDLNNGLFNTRKHTRED